MNHLWHGKLVLEQLTHVRIIRVIVPYFKCLLLLFMSLCFLVGLKASKPMHQGTRQIDCLQHRCCTQAYSFKTSKTEVKETTEFNGITLSPWLFCQLGRWEIMQMSGCANVRYLIYSMHNWWGERRRERIIEVRFVNSWEVFCSAFDEQKDFQGWFSYAGNTERHERIRGAPSKSRLLIYYGWLITDLPASIYTPLCQTRAWW